MKLTKKEAEERIGQGLIGAFDGNLLENYAGISRKMWRRLIKAALAGSYIDPTLTLIQREHQGRKFVKKLLDEGLGILENNLAAELVD